jgi:hypothetical protein
MHIWDAVRNEAHQNRARGRRQLTPRQRLIFGFVWVGIGLVWALLAILIIAVHRADHSEISSQVVFWALAATWLVLGSIQVGVAIARRRNAAAPVASWHSR